MPQKIAGLTFLLLAWCSTGLTSDYAAAVPTARPRLGFRQEELIKRIEWAEPGGPLGAYVDDLKKTVLEDRTWAAWKRSHPALIYLLTGDERFAAKAYEEHKTSSGGLEDYVGMDTIVYDWLVAGDAYWQKNAFPAEVRQAFEERIAKRMKLDLHGGYISWTPHRNTVALASALTASRALIGVPAYDAEARAAYNEAAAHTFEKYFPDWNVCGGYLACGTSYGSIVSDSHTWIAAMLDEARVDEMSPWEFCRFERERLMKKITQEIPHTGVVDGLGGLTEPHGDINAYGEDEPFAVGLLAKYKNDLLGQWYLRNVYTSRSSAAWRSFLPLLFLNPEVQPVGPRDAGLPLAYYTPYHKPFRDNACAEGAGQVMMRSHWGDNDQTYLYFRCGDFFDGHQDIGNLHFSLYRKGYFAVEAANRHTYDDNNFREIIQFEHTSLPRNTIQIMDTDHFHGPWNKLTPLFGGTQNHFTYRAYREGGHVEAFEDRNAYTYVCADATPMYRRAKKENPARDRASEVKRQLVYVRSQPPGSDDIIVIFDRVAETPENFAVQSPLKLGGASKWWGLNVATTPRRQEEALQPGIRSFDSSGAPDLFTIPAGADWPGEENPASQLHIQALLPAERNVRWIGGVDPEFDAPSANLAKGLYTVRLVAANTAELKAHPCYIPPTSSNRWCKPGNTAGRYDTQIPFFDPNIGRYRMGLWIWPAREVETLKDGECILWQCRVTGESLTILLNGETFKSFSFAEYPTLVALEQAMFEQLRTPGNNNEAWRVVLSRGYEWWADWCQPVLGHPELETPEKQGFHFDEPEKIEWPIPGTALDGLMHLMGGIYAEAYPHLKRYPNPNASKGPRESYSQSTKQICGLWRMETRARGASVQENVHFLHVLAPVDQGVSAPQSSVIETEQEAIVTVQTAQGRNIRIHFRKLGQQPGGTIMIEGGELPLAQTALAENIRLDDMSSVPDIRTGD